MAGRLTPQTLDLEVRGSSLARHFVPLDKELYSTLSLFTQVYKWVPATYFCGETLGWTSIPSMGGVAIFLGMLHATETRNKLRAYGPLAHVHLYLYHLIEYKVTSRYLIKDAKAAVACVKSISAKLKNQMKNIMQRTLQYST